MLILVVALIASIFYGSARWNASTRDLRARLEANRRTIASPTVDFQELDDLPGPVQRFFRTVLQEGQFVVSGVRVQHRGTFNLGETADNWKPFRSDQQVITQRPGFHWSGRIAMAPGLQVYVHDAYIAGEGVLTAALLGLFSLVDLRGSGEVAEGELMRFFAEAAWYPTALLPGNGTRWAAKDDRSAYATLEDSEISITMLFSFTEQGEIDTVYADSRGRTVGGKVIPTPWQGRFWNYEVRGGMRVPLDGEVAWILPEGTKPYWRGHIDEIRYEFAR